MGVNTRRQGSLKFMLKVGYHRTQKENLCSAKKKCEKGEEVNRKAGLWLQFFSVKGEATSFSKSEGVREFGVGV